jgi:PilZ domain
LAIFLGLEGMNEETRFATRHRVLKGARIHFGGGSIDCTVRNISETGAALEVTSPLGIPTEFTLVSDGDHRPCRVVWRKERRIGITFDKEQSED